MPVIHLDRTFFDSHVFPFPLPEGHGGGITIDAELWKVDSNGRHVQDLTPYFVEGAVDWRYERQGGIAGDPNGTGLMATITLSRTDLIEPLADFIAPTMRLSFDDGRRQKEIPLGVYTVTRPSETHSESTSEATFEARDLTHLLASSAFLSPHNVPVGVDVDAEIRSIIEAAGTTLHNIRRSDRTTGRPRTFSRGMSRLGGANRLAHAIGWYRLFAELDGSITTLPYRKHANQHPVVTLTENDFVNLVEVTPIGEVANVVLLSADNPHTTGRQYFVKAINDDINDPLSTVNIGREIVYQGSVIPIQDVESQADLHAIADTYLEEARSAETTVTFQVPPDTNFGMLRTVTLNTTGSRSHLAGHYRLKAWSIGIPAARPDSDLSAALLTMECSRLVRFGQGAGEEDAA
jgi:hypothetical protein